MKPVTTKEDFAFHRERMLKLGYRNIDEKVFDAISKYLAYAEHGETKRGLFLYGGVGTGKTKALGLLIRPRAIYTAQSLCDIWERSGETAAKEIVFPPVYDVCPPGCFDLAIDDLGAEAPVNRYGKKADALADLIAHRYVLFQRIPKTKLFITSNLDQKGVTDRYGERIWSRICEMCTPLKFTGEDQRVKGV